jgi:hypothetical protein
MTDGSSPNPRERVRTIWEELKQDALAGPGAPDPLRAAVARALPDVDPDWKVRRVFLEARQSGDGSETWWSVYCELDSGGFGHSVPYHGENELTAELLADVARELQGVYGDHFAAMDWYHPRCGGPGHTHPASVAVIDGTAMWCCGHNPDVWSRPIGA